MGICSSCLGLTRHNSQSEPSDTSHLLGEQYPQHYGTSMTPGLPQPDPEEIRRQREALERLCAQTSDNLIDVSQPTHAPSDLDTPSLRPNISHDFPRLFSEHFNLVASRNPSRSGSVVHTYGSQTSSRPASSGAGADAEEDEGMWLDRVLPRSANSGDGPEAWDQVKGEWQGKLTFDFDAIMGGGRKYAQHTT